MKMSVNPQSLKDIPEVVKYFKDIGIEEPIEQRIQLVYSYIQKLIPFTLKDIFVSDYIEEDGTHKFVHADLFSDTHLISIFDFTRNDAFATSPYDIKIANMRIDSQEYDFQKASPKSRLRVRLVFFNTERMYGEFKATGNNCDYLMRILEKYIIPRIIERR